ncbi:MAG: HAMP domain-containing histidine kinase [Rhodospirillaceae bacterium]|nr:HAMP domain-containing histidine kinase [Rhodospirillales bacterium]
MSSRMSRAARSLAARLVLVAVAFAAVPVFLYGEFSAAEGAKRQVLLARLQVEGQLIARGLALGLARIKAPSVVETRKVLDELNPAGVNVRLLFRPVLSAGKPGPVFLVGAIPALAADSIEIERERLAGAGIIRAVPDSCEGGHALDLHYSSANGIDEVLTSIVPFTTGAGCWAVVTSQTTSGITGSFLDRPYWESPEVRMAAGVYALLMVLVLTLFGGLWFNLRRFGYEARNVADGGPASRPFVKANRIPELDGVARELDQMVGNLRSTAEAFRFAAEENAHAFKTPIATIAQAVEPLRRAVGKGEDSAGRSLQVIEASLDRLDSLVAASRRLDQVNADLVSPPRQAVDLSRLVAALLDSYDETTADRDITIERRVTSGCVVRASIEMMETVIENVLENALSFSPEHGSVQVTVARGDGRVVMVIDDQGPGATAEVLERMFERYVSHRPESDPSGAPHFGIGLWIVRRNVAAVGGTVEARNRTEGGMRVTVTLPSA